MTSFHHPFGACKPGLSSTVDEAAVFLMKDAHGHPFTGNDQIEASVVIVVEPRGRRHHSGVGKHRGALARDVPKVAFAVVLEQIAPRWSAVRP